MRIVIPGGTGQVGTLLARAFHADGHDVVVLSRKPRSAPWRTVAWDARTIGPWRRELDGADAVINLAGRSVNCRYNARNRLEIMDSRVNSTKVVAQAIAECARAPRVWLQSSTAKSRRVVPRRLVEAGFDFVYPRWMQAAEELVHRRS